MLRTCVPVRVTDCDACGVVNRGISPAQGIDPRRGSPAVAGTGSGAFVLQPYGLAFTDANTLVVADTTSLDQIALRVADQGERHPLYACKVRAA